MGTRPHNALKAPWFVFCGFVGLLAALSGALNGVWWLLVLGLALVVACLALLRLIRKGRNPRWLRSPLDPLDK
jgi:hypothetical protein